MDNMNSLRATVAALESKVDMLESELSYLNEILIRCGFPEGVSTLKSTIEELLKEGLDSSLQEKPRTFLDGQ